MIYYRVAMQNRGTEGRRYRVEQYNEDQRHPVFFWRKVTPTWRHVPTFAYESDVDSSYYDREYREYAVFENAVKSMCKLICFDIRTQQKNWGVWSSVREDDVMNSVKYIPRSQMQMDAFRERIKQ